MAKLVLVSFKEKLFSSHSHTKIRRNINATTTLSSTSGIILKIRRMLITLLMIIYFGRASFHCRLYFLSEKHAGGVRDFGAQALTCIPIFPSGGGTRVALTESVYVSMTPANGK